MAHPDRSHRGWGNSRSRSLRQRGSIRTYLHIHTKHVRIDCQLSLKGGCWLMPGESTERKLKTSRILLKSCCQAVIGSLSLLAFKLQDSRESMSFTPIDELPLDTGHSAAIKILVSGTLNIHIVVGSTYVISRSITLNAGRMSASNRFPSKPGPRNLHTSAHASPRPT